MIKIENLSKAYKTKQVLQGITVQWQDGQVIGIVGLNGAGKTTLFNCIAGVISGKGTIHYSDGNLHEHLVYLRTNPYMMPRITGREYIRLVCNAGKVKEAAIDEKNIFDLPLHEYASQYSTGMKKKLALTAALHLNKHVYLLDEPFNGVDMESNLIIIEIIRRLQSLGKIVIISSHIINILHELVDQLYLLDNGSIINYGQDYEAVVARLQESVVATKVDRLNLK